MNKPRRADHFPVVPKMLILLAVAAEPQHGYALFSQIVGDTMGLYVRKSSLYRGLIELEAEGLVESAESQLRTAGRAYRLTMRGHQVLRLTGQSWERVGRLAIERTR